MDDKEAARPPLVLKRPTTPFRLESHIELAASDKYNDSYKCQVMARKIRDRFAVTVDITHDPVTTRVYSNTWLFKDMAVCWEKFHAISDIVSDIRNFVEAEGLKNMVFSYMVKHSLSGISADIENIYETNIPTVKQVLDNSTKGNLLKNFPHYPFRSQAGADDMETVYTSTGGAENPIPEDGIARGVEYATPQHLRQQKGLKDVIPCPISKFQEAAGITVGMIKGAASMGTVKTAQAEPEDDNSKYLEAVKENAGKAIEFGRKAAIKHYMDMTGATQAEADAFYHGVRAACTESQVVLNLSPSALAILLSSNAYNPKMESEPMMAKFNQQARKREQAERAMGCYGLAPMYASVSMSPVGNRSYGKCSISLQGLEDKTVLVCGDSFRLRNPAREDYVPDPELVMYPFSALDDCKAASIIMNMRARDLAAGPAVALAHILDRNVEYGKCEALIFKPIGTEHVVEITAEHQEMAKSIRKILVRCSKLIPVTCAENAPFTLDLASRLDVNEDSPPTRDAKQHHFEVGDPVSTKRMPSQPPLNGKIMEIKDCKVTVEWESGERSMFDMSEAMLRLLPGPGVFQQKKGMVIYSLPGMDSDAVIMLSEANVDPVSLYSIVSHHSSNAPIPQLAALERLVSSLGSVGINGRVVKGFVPAGAGPHAFEKREWVEADLMTGARLIVDVASGINIMVGDPDKYIPAEDYADIEIE